MKRKAILLLLSGATTSLMAMYAEQATLYEDPSILGMGGVDIAVGGHSTSLFTNPAGLANIKKEDGFIVDMLSVGYSGTSKTNDFLNDLNDAGDADDSLSATSAVLEQYSGEHFHTEVNAYMSLSKNSEQFAWSIGLLTAADINLMTHKKTNEHAELLETTSRVYGGVVLGGAKPYQTPYGEVDLGVGLKYISQKSYEGTLGLSELVDEDDNEEEENDIVDTLQEKYERQNNGIGIDLGLIYKPTIPQLSLWHPAVGLSIMNIGSINMDDNYGGQPTTVNIGVSVSPEVKYIDSLVIGMDYVDLFNATKLREYDFSDPDGTTSYKDHTVVSFKQNFRLGVKAALVNSKYFSSALSLGLYQGAYTAGLNLDITILKINFATYQEEVGSSSLSIQDRRYITQIAIGW